MKPDNWQKVKAIFNSVLEVEAGRREDYLAEVCSGDDQIRRSPAFDLYMRGKVKVTSVNTDDNQAAINLLEQAVTTDPNYAEAWAALAKAYIFRSFNFASSAEQKKLNEDAEVAVEKALELKSAR